MGEMEEDPALRERGAAGERRRGRNGFSKTAQKRTKKRRKRNKEEKRGELEEDH